MSKYIHVGEYENSKVDQMRRQCVVCMCMYRPQERMHVCVYMCDHAGGMNLS